MKFVIIETPVEGELASVLIYARWAIRDSINRDEVALPALGPDCGFANIAERAVFYVDRGWTDGMEAALAVYLKAGVPVERRWMEDRQEIDDPAVARFLAQQRIDHDKKLAAIAEKVGVELRWA